MSSTPPPLFPSAPPPPPPPLPPPQKSGVSGGKIALLVCLLLALVVLAGAWLAFQVYHRHQASARQASELKRLVEKSKLDKLRPRDPLSAAQQKALLEFGEGLASELSAGDLKSAAKRVDIIALADRVFLPLGAAGDSTTWREARKGFEKAIVSSAGGLAQVPADSKIKVLRVVERDGSPAILLRLILPNGALTFLEVLVRVEGDSFHVIDLYNHAFGILVTEESRNTLLVLMPNTSANLLAGLFGSSTGSKAKVDAALRLREIISKGDLDAMRKHYNGLSADLRKERILFIQYLQALSSNPNSSPEAEDDYYQALVEAPAILGENGASELLRVDVEYLNGNFAEAANLVAQVEAKVGRDAYLTCLRANMHVELNQLDQARALAEEAARMEPELLSTVDVFLAIHAKAGDHAALLQVLRDLKADRGLTIPAANLSDAQYDAFRESPEFATWKAENP